MAGTQPPDRVQREIEELLDQLDTFVPEERFRSKMRRKQREARGPNIAERTWTSISQRLSGITLGHIMIAGLILLVAAWLVPDLFNGYDRWALYTGVLLAGGAFLLSVIWGDRRRNVTGGRTYQKRWRGQVIEYSEPSTPSKFREWLRNRRRR